METAAPQDPAPGAAIVHFDVVGTVVIVVVGILGLTSAALAKSVLVPVAAAAAVIGIAGFVWSYFGAVERSRTNEISVSQLYGTAGTVAPPAVKRRLQWSLWVQIAVAIVVMVMDL